MIKHWWKILAVVIILYTFIAGLLIPLNSGITDVRSGNADLVRAKAGETVNLQVTGYNTQLKKAGNELTAWLMVDVGNKERKALRANKIQAINDQEITVEFSLPPALPVKKKSTDCSLLLNSPVDGSSILPSAIFVSQQQLVGDTAGWGDLPKKSLHPASGIKFPFRNILSETIRNLFYHVPLWFGMMLIFLVSTVYSIRYLRTANPLYDNKAMSLVTSGVLFGLLGLVTGAIWAKNTWGAYWSWDIKQNMSAIAMLIYLAYFVLRQSFEDRERQARISAVYNIFAFAALIPLLFVIPRLTDSLHPGNGGNPGFGGEDLDNTMRLVFYPAIIGWTLFGFWVAELFYRVANLADEEEEIGDIFDAGIQKV